MQCSRLSHTNKESIFLYGVKFATNEIKIVENGITKTTAVFHNKAQPYRSYIRRINDGFKNGIANIGIRNRTGSSNHGTGKHGNVFVTALKIQAEFYGVGTLNGEVDTINGKARIGIKKGKIVVKITNVAVESCTITVTTHDAHVERSRAF